MICLPRLAVSIGFVKGKAESLLFIIKYIIVQVVFKCGKCYCGSKQVNMKSKKNKRAMVCRFSTGLALAPVSHTIAAAQGWLWGLMHCFSSKIRQL